MKTSLHLLNFMHQFAMFDSTMLRPFNMKKYIKFFKLVMEPHCPVCKLNVSIKNKKNKQFSKFLIHENCYKCTLLPSHHLGSTCKSKKRDLILISDSFLYCKKHAKIDLEVTESKEDFKWEQDILFKALNDTSKLGTLQKIMQMLELVDEIH